MYVPQAGAAELIEREREAFRATLRDRWMPAFSPGQRNSPPLHHRAAGSPKRGGVAPREGREAVQICDVQQRLGLARSDYAELQAENDELQQQFVKMLSAGQVSSDSSQVPHPLHGHTPCMCMPRVCTSLCSSPAVHQHVHAIHTYAYLHRYVTQSSA